MRGRTAWWVAGCVAAGSLALMVAGLILAYVDRHLVPATMTGWDFSDVFGDVTNMALPVMGFVLAPRRPTEPARLAGTRGGPDAGAEKLR